MTGLIQGSKEWLEFRRNKIMASDAAIIMGLSPWKTSLQLYSDKINGTESFTTPAMQRGKDLEDTARRCFEMMTGYFVYPKVMLHPLLAWMGASFDGINEDGIVVEIKCGNLKDHKNALLGIVPEHYMAQLQHQMYVAEVGQMYYFSYYPDCDAGMDAAIVRVQADREYQIDMLEKEKAFWDCLQSRTPPEPSERDIQVREDRTWLMKEEELFRLNVMIDEMEEKRDEIKNSMIEMCDGRVTKGYRLKLTPIHRKGNIDYSRIEMLKEMDLEIYRKEGSTSWRVDLA